MQGTHPCTRKLLRWYESHARELPWRAHPEPYATWLSEVILQQTRVDTGTAYWHRFMVAFPTVQDLAFASSEEVMALWKGLGYYSRARNLHVAAQFIVHNSRGKLPQDAEGWKALPGVGPYTAAAISSICFGEAVPVIDGNVQRVLARLFDIPDPVDRKLGKAAIECAAEDLVDPGQPGISNQAWMELGALVCKPKNPNCDHCPLTGDCLARSRGTVLERPVKQPKKRPKEVTVIFDVHLQKNDGSPWSWWIERRPEKGIWGGLEAFPLTMTDGHSNPKDEADLWGPVEHILTHRRMNAWFRFIHGPLDPGHDAAENQGQWAPVMDGSRTWPRLIDKVLNDLQRRAVEN